MLIRSIGPAFAATALATSLLAAPAFAADYLRGTQVVEAQEAAAYDRGINWAGFYFGGGAGVSDTKFKPGEGLQDLANFAFRNTRLGNEFNMGNLLSTLPAKRDSGATYFGFAGYNWVFGDVIMGLEADYTRSGHEYLLSDTISRRAITSDGTINDFTLVTRQGAKLDDYATARVRFGWAYGSLMPYATIGGAVGRFNTISTINATNFITRTNPVTGALETGYATGRAPGDPAVGTTKKNVYGFGLAIGGGLEWALSDNLFIRGEYQLIRFADVEGTTTTINTARAAAGVKF